MRSRIEQVAAVSRAVLPPNIRPQGGVEVTVIPVLLGEGIPLLPSPAGRAALQLRAHRVYEKTGTLSL